MYKALLPIIEIIGRILSDVLIAWASKPDKEAGPSPKPNIDTGVESDIADVARRLRLDGDQN